MGEEGCEGEIAVLEEAQSVIRLPGEALAARISWDRGWWRKPAAFSRCRVSGVAVVGLRMTRGRWESVLPVPCLSVLFMDLLYTG